MAFNDDDFSAPAGLRTDKGHVIVTNEQFERQVAMLESANIQVRFELNFPNDPGKSLAFA